jgi:hypothetical protein
MDIGVSIPLDECKDLSCADAIRRLLRWVPDVVSTVDYALDIAAISFLRRSQMKSTSISLESGIGELFLRPRYDLQVPAVVLKFETTNSANGKTWKELVVQRYPDGCSGTELKALVLTINLEGSKSNYLIQSIETEPIDTASVSWWKAHVPLLSGIESSTISIANASRGSALPNELMSGTIANWMDREAETDVIRCQISYDGEDEAISGRTAAVRIVATDATSGVYKKLLSLTTAEIVPQNLAEQIYAAVNPLHYDGTVTIVGEEISQNFIGKLLNICGGQPAWEAMNAVVQEVSEQLDSGYTVVKFGPAKHLGAADLAELTRSGRLLFTSTNSSERSTAEASGNGVVEQGIFSRVDNTSFGSGSYRMMKFSDPENPAVVVRIDTADVPMDAATAKFREEDVCDSGVLKKRYSLATEPFLPE